MQPEALTRDSWSQGSARPVPQEDQPEGNGTGFVWDGDGSIVTNFHVLASALAAIPRRPGGLPRPGGPRPVVAKVTLLGAHRSDLPSVLQVLCEDAS